MKNTVGEDAYIRPCQKEKMLITSPDLTEACLDFGARLAFDFERGESEIVEKKLYQVWDA